MNEVDTVKQILDECKTIAVVGLSANSIRPSNGVATFMQDKGYKVIPINPNESEVLGERAYPDLSSVPFDIELVDIFRNSDFAGVAVDEAIEIGANAVWFQEGVIDENAASRAEEAGLLVVMNRCWLKEYYMSIG